MKGFNLIAVAFSCLFLILAVHTAQANYYVAGYFPYTQASANDGYIAATFQGTNPSVIPSGDWLADVGSIVGGISTGSCPCLYQTGYALNPDGSVSYSPQIWNHGGLLSGQELSNVGQTGSISFEGLIRYDSSTGNIKFTGFVYNTQRQVDYNEPTVYNIFSYNTGDSNFLYGTSNINGYTVERFQFGVESPASMASSSWYVKEDSIEVYDAVKGWQYQSASSTEGSSNNWDIHVSGGVTNLYHIGGTDMAGVNLNAGNSGADAPDWTYTGNSIGNGASVWSGSGGFAPYPCQNPGYC